MSEGAASTQGNQRPHAPIAVFASGGGRSLENLATLAACGELEAPIGLVLANRADAFVLDRARRHRIPTTIIDPTRELSTPEFSRAAFAAVTSAGCGFVVLAGFLRLLEIPAGWLGRVINIHPALLPAHGGKGFYGDRVHRAVLAAGDKQTGCTVHFVDNAYDTGPIILRREVAVFEMDTLDSLASRVFEAEKLALPDAINRCLTGSATFTPAGPAQ